ncbi:MFS general substrate transporter [Dacryopinax primogenitus]|uniref:MFS general substrate transporter n=1 Tax=Dacryopinax primogenitus (strain DJM 731) TaxID=1858805 RepID=M5FY40_DACPD|nr:MFS general substrate transporter [Dacryopinax primogenitus]EJU02981.1 MFS general substrate transporter [Dacryopinax primogenitus]
MSYHLLPASPRESGDSDSSLDEDLPVKEDTNGPETLSTVQVRLILVQLYTIVIFYGMDSTIVATLATPISSAFGELHRAAWLNNAYLLTVACCAPLYGRLSDIIGRRKALGIGLAVFILGNALCGAAGNMNVLILARLLQGAGGGGAGLVATIVISDITPLRDRGLLKGVSAVCWASGQGLGGVFGGLIADAVGWRWAFLFQLPVLLSIFCGLMNMISYDLGYQRPADASLRRRLDWNGSVLFFIGIGSLVFSIAYKTNEDLSWSHPLVALTLLLSILASGLFVYIELQTDEPVLDLRLLGNPSLACIGGTSFLSSAATVSVGLYFPMLLQIVRGNSASSAGMHLVPNTISTACGGIVSGLYIRKTGRYYKLILFLAFLQLLACLSLASLNRTTWEPATWLVLLPLGFSTNGYNGSTFIALLNAVDAKDLAVVTSMAFMFRSCGQVLGMAFSSAVQQTTLSVSLAHRLPASIAPQIMAEVRKNAASILSLPPEPRDACISAYSTSLHVVFLTSAGLLVGAGALAALIREREIEGGRTEKGEDERGDKD